MTSIDKTQASPEAKSHKRHKPDSQLNVPWKSPDFVLPTWLTTDLFHLLSIRTTVNLFYVWQPDQMAPMMESLKLIRTHFFKGGTDKTFWFQWSKHRLHLVVEHASALLHLDLDTDAKAQYNDIDDAPTQSLCFGVISDYFLTRLQMLDASYPAVVGFDSSQHMLCFIQSKPLSKCIEVHLLEATELPMVSAQCIDVPMYCRQPANPDQEEEERYKKDAFMTFISQNPVFDIVYQENYQEDTKEDDSGFLLQSHDVVHGSVAAMYRVTCRRAKEQIRINKFGTFTIRLKSSQLEILPKLTAQHLLPQVTMGLYMPPPIKCLQCKARLEVYHEENAWLELCASSRANSCCVQTIKNGARGDAFFLRFHATSTRSRLQMRLWTPAFQGD